MDDSRQGLIVLDPTGLDMNIETIKQPVIETERLLLRPRMVQRIGEENLAADGLELRTIYSMSGLKRRAADADG